MLFKRLDGGWTRIGSTYASGPLAAGTQLKLMAVGNTLSFLENGVERIAVGDSSLTGGAPGIMAFGTPPWTTGAVVLWASRCITSTPTPAALLRTT